MVTTAALRQGVAHVAEQHNDGIGEHVGLNVARFRSYQQLSRSALAERAGVSTRTLTNVEQGRNVTLETLLAIADGLGIDLVTLLFDGYEGANGEIRIVRAADVEPIDLGAQLVRHLCEVSAVTRLSVAHVTLLSGPSQHHAPSVSGVLHRLYVLDGTVLFGPAEHPARLRPGDFATLRADRGYVIGAEAEQASGLLLTTINGS
jgi:transcriptional regulator with XRE-family HTH domain